LLVMTPLYGSRERRAIALVDGNELLAPRARSSQNAICNDTEQRMRMEAHAQHFAARMRDERHIA
jgi:hypothetical protein